MKAVIALVLMAVTAQAQNTLESATGRPVNGIPCGCRYVPGSGGGLWYNTRQERKKL